MRGRNLNLMAFILICAVIAYTDLKKCGRLPWPPRFIFAGLTFFIMTLISMVDDTLGGVTSIGFVIAIFVKELTPGSKGIMQDCNPGGATGQPQTIDFLGENQPPSTASLSEYNSSQAQPAQGSGTQFV